MAEDKWLHPFVYDYCSDQQGLQLVDLYSWLCSYFSWGTDSYKWVHLGRLIKDILGQLQFLSQGPWLNRAFPWETWACITSSQPRFERIPMQIDHPDHSVAQNALGM